MSELKKEQWGPGPWQDEPDRLDWRDERTGLHCAIRRNDLFGNLCGYVGVPVGHPFHGWSYDDKIHSRPEDYEGTLDDIGVVAAFMNALGEDREHGTIDLGMALKVHQGISWSGRGPTNDMPSGLWWFGFDCGHAWDYMPGLSKRLEALPKNALDELNKYRMKEQVYRTIDYVKTECASLAFQLRQLETRVVRTEMPEALKGGS